MLPPQLPAEGQLPSNEVMHLPAKQEAFATNKQDGREVGLAQVTKDKINWSEDFNNATNNHKIFNASKDACIPKFHPYNDSTEETAGKRLQDFIEVLVNGRTQAEFVWNNDKPAPSLKLQINGHMVQVSCDMSTEDLPTKVISVLKTQVGTLQSPDPAIPGRGLFSYKSGSSAHPVL
ncbi:hypothetical protein NDA18_003857 [Ustilago nuda]|nr:hypothetical protein NDA18_003857 [Ustilago nuda]